MRTGPREFLGVLIFTFLVSFCHVRENRLVVTLYLIFNKMSYFESVYGEVHI